MAQIERHSRESSLHGLLTLTPTVDWGFKHSHMPDEA
jgi:hypothetical protein